MDESAFDRLVLWHRLLPPTRPEQDDPIASGEWLDAILKRAEGVGAKTLARVGGAAAIAFEAHDLRVAVNYGLAILTNAEAAVAPPGGLQVALGLAAGPVNVQGEAHVGAVIDRAQLLANRARRGELVLDGPTREAAAAEFLFARSVGTGAAALRGSALDRATPLRRVCRDAVQHLKPAPVPPATSEALAGVHTMAEDRDGSSLVVLRGPSGAGATAYIETLVDEFEPPLVLRFGGVPGALEPRGSLRLALTRQWGSAERLISALGEIGEPLADVLRGLPVDSSVLHDGLIALIERLGAASRPWFVFDPLPSIDASTLQIFAELSQQTSLMMFVRAPVDGTLPQPLAHLDWSEFVLPSLRIEGAKFVARAVLGTDEDDDVVRRIAVLGGDTPLGVVEAARTLVAAGDLVHEDGVFRWRTAPRAGVRALAMDHLLQERIEALEEGPLRLLEAACMSPPGTQRLLTASVAERDGLLAERRHDATQALQREAFIDSGRLLQPTSEHLRRLVLRNMPPARTAELSRFIADAMTESSLGGGPLAKATVGYFLQQGGAAGLAAQALLDAARGALEASMMPAARRLAASAVQVHPLVDIRTEAGRISRAAASGEIEDENEMRVSTVAVNALLAGDLEKVERTIDAAIAEGRDLAAADRVRAMTFLAKGETENALAAFERVQSKTGEDLKSRARAALTLAWIKLHSGDILASIRACLDGLAATRRLKDPRGEAAALHTIAAALRSLGRDAEADAVVEASPA